jgi:hypothetical protein
VRLHRIAAVFCQIGFSCRAFGSRSVISFAAWLSVSMTCPFRSVIGEASGRFQPVGLCAFFAMLSAAPYPGEQPVGDLQSAP